jgi:hypothetical protein
MLAGRPQVDDDFDPFLFQLCQVIERGLATCPNLIVEAKESGDVFQFPQFVCFLDHRHIADRAGARLFMRFIVVAATAGRADVELLWAGQAGLRGSECGNRQSGEDDQRHSRY